MQQLYYPFGMPLQKVEQKDKTPKKIFVLGVYASAVHAEVKDNNGKTVARALAVASEPEIFWRGDNAAEIIRQISIADSRYTLSAPADRSMNGPSGQTLDEHYLQPLNVTRTDVWLSDLLPESRINGKQKAAIERLGLQTTIPDFSRAELNNGKRRNEILSELVASKAERLVLLGDDPIKYFLRYVADCKYDKLSDFGETPETYGQPVEMNIGGSNIQVVALCHPRQAGRLGASNPKWTNLHRHWIIQKTNQYKNNNQQ